MNVTVVEPDGTTTKLNEPGPTLTATEVDALLAATAEAARGAAWVVGCGSLPPGAPDDLYAVLVARARALGVRVAIDSSGAPMVAAVAARPSLIKPNHEELAELVGSPLPTLGHVRDAAADLVASGIETVAVSLGADGALLVADGISIHVRTRITRPISTVGAGDCMLAGLLAATAAGASAEDALATGSLWGSAAVTLPGSRVPAPADLHGIPVEVTVDPDPLSLSTAEVLPSPERKLMSLISERQVVLDLAAPDRQAATRTLAETLVATGRCTDLDAFLADVRAREAQMATGLPGGIGIPHARSAAITEPSLVFGRATPGIDWGAEDGPATLIFLIAAPDGGGEEHLKILAALARKLMRSEFRTALLEAPDAAAVVDIVEKEVVTP